MIMHGRWQCWLMLLVVGNEVGFSGILTPRATAFFVALAELSG